MTNVQKLTNYPVYTKTTGDVCVSVYPIFLENQSNPDDYHFVWAYHVKIENHGDSIVQLRSRFWRIIDGLGRIQEVNGSGVVGEQPVLRPGESFEYTSGAPLSTPSGVMEGHYLMESLTTGSEILVGIPSFSLDSPFEMGTVN